MTKDKLIPLVYQADNIYLRNFCDMLAYETDSESSLTKLAAARFGGYPEMVQAMSDAIYGGGTITAELPSGTKIVTAKRKQYQRLMNHDGVYAEATLLLMDDPEGTIYDEQEEDDADDIEDAALHNYYIFCEPGNRTAVFEAIDKRVAVPLIPAFQEYLLDELMARGILTPLTVISAFQPLEGWKLTCTKDDANIVAVLEDGLRSGWIQISNSEPSSLPFPNVASVTDYLNVFSDVLAARIKEQFQPLFDPAVDALSAEVLKINTFVQAHAGYPLYAAQLGVAEAVKRKLDHGKIALIVAECGSGKSKIGAAALRAHQLAKGQEKTLNLVLGPSHMTGKWVRELKETVPEAVAVTARSIRDLQEIKQRYEQDGRPYFVVLSKEKARDGYMRQPAVVWSRRKDGFVCPDCGTVIEVELGKGSGYMVPADQHFFLRENKLNHACEYCGSSLWTVLNPSATDGCGQWAKLGDYGFVYRSSGMAACGVYQRA
jgi:Rad3-related DNA helicases